MSGREPKLDLLALVKSVGATQLQLDVQSSKLAQTRAAETAVGTELVGSQESLRLTGYMSPLPPPDVLVEYEMQHPGLTADFVNEWKSEQAHRRAIEQQKVAGRERRELMGLQTARLKVILQFAIGFAGLVIVYGAARLDQPKLAGALAVLEGIAVGGWAVVRRFGNPKREQE